MLIFWSIVLIYLLINWIVFSRFFVTKWFICVTNWNQSRWDWLIPILFHWSIPNHPNWPMILDWWRPIWMKIIKLIGKWINLLSIFLLFWTYLNWIWLINVRAFNPSRLSRLYLAKAWFQCLNSYRWGPKKHIGVYFHCFDPWLFFHFYSEVGLMTL